MTRTPLAWKNLINEPRRLLLASAGVGFAAVLMFTQNGFRNALLDSPVQLIELMRCDLVAISPARYMLPVNQRFPRDLLRRAQAVPIVEQTQPLLIERLMARIRVAGKPARPIRVVSVPPENIAFQPSGPQYVVSESRESKDDTAESGPNRQLVPASPKSQGSWLAVPGLSAAKAELRAPGTALVDSKTRREFGFLFDNDGKPLPQTIELAKKEIRFIGSVEIGTDFANEGTLLIDEAAFQRYFPLRGRGKPLEVVDVGMIRLADNVDPATAARQLTAMAPGQWEVLTRAQLKNRETTFWSEQTPVGMIFRIGTLMGFTVGVIICYQILYTNLQDAMPEFATLKAMGYPNRFFIMLVIRQSIYLSLFGFLPAVVVTWGLFQLLETLSGLPMLLTPWRAITVLGLTMTMCLLSGLLALRKLLRADPASLF